MNQSNQSDLERRAEAAADEIKELIRSEYPDAQFELTYGDEPPGLRLRVLVDVDDVEPVEQLYRPRLRAIRDQQRLPLLVLIQQPVHRVLPDYRGRLGR